MCVSVCERERVCVCVFLFVYTFSVVTFLVSAFRAPSIIITIITAV